jgi:hypothetical protein
MEEWQRVDGGGGGWDSMWERCVLILAIERARSMIALAMGSGVGAEDAEIAGGNEVASSGGALGWTVHPDIAAKTEAAARSLALNTKLIGFEILPKLLQRL